MCCCGTRKRGVLHTAFIICTLSTHRMLACFATMSAQEPKQITDAALDGSDPIAVEAVDMFMSIVGAEAGAMSLRCLAKGGQMWIGKLVLVDAQYSSLVFFCTGQACFIWAPITLQLNNLKLHLHVPPQSKTQLLITCQAN